MFGQGLRFSSSILCFFFVSCFCFGSSMEEFGVKNELGFVWVGGVVCFFFFNPFSLSGHNLAIRLPN